MTDRVLREVSGARSYMDPSQSHEGIIVASERVSYLE